MEWRGFKKRKLIVRPLECKKACLVDSSPQGNGREHCLIEMVCRESKAWLLIYGEHSQQPSFVVGTAGHRHRIKASIYSFLHQQIDEKKWNRTPCNHKSNGPHRTAMVFWSISHRGHQCFLGRRLREQQELL